MTACDTCGDEPSTFPNTSAVVGCVSVRIGNDESYWFCSEVCYEQHWVSEDVEGGQQRLHEVEQ